MSADRRAPTVSVCIPTYQRLQLLRRAVASVFAQTWQDWELVISDDEDPPGETWEYLQELRTQDVRVTVLRNLEPHGQVPNTNRTLLAARGTWIKPLHDDDILRPDCLETLISATRGLPSVVMVSGLVVHYRQGRPVADRRRRREAPLELIPQKSAHLAMYLQDCRAGPPTQVMVHRKAIEQGALFGDVPGIIWSVDALWNCAVLKYGDVLFVNKVLAEHHQHGGTLTTRLTAEQLEAEYPIVLEHLRKCVDSSLKPPPIGVVLGMARCIRGFYHLKSGRFGKGLRTLGKVRSLDSWMLAARWGVNQLFPGTFQVAHRISVPVQGARQQATKVGQDLNDSQPSST